MDVRAYRPGDRAGCVAVVESMDGDVGRFSAFLDGLDCPYFVMEHEGDIVGCGGFRVSADEGVAQLVWGMIRGDLHRQGLGRFLLMFRLREIGKTADVQAVRVESPRESSAFFECQGFRVVGTTDDGRVELVKKMAVCG